MILLRIMWILWIIILEIDIWIFVIIWILARLKWIFLYLAIICLARQISN